MDARLPGHNRDWAIDLDILDTIIAVAVRVTEGHAVCGTDAVRITVLMGYLPDSWQRDLHWNVRMLLLGLPDFWDCTDTIQRARTCGPALRCHRQQNYNAIQCI